MLKQLTRAKSQSNELTKWTRSLDSHVPGAHMEIDARAHMQFACGPTYCFMMWCPMSHHKQDICLCIHLHDGAACVPIILQDQKNEISLQQKIQQASLHEVEVIFRRRGSKNLHECRHEAPVPMIMAFQSNNASQLHSALVMATNLLKQQGLRYSIAEVNMAALPCQCCKSS